MNEEEVLQAIAELDRAVHILEIVRQHIESKRAKVMRTEHEMFLIPNAVMGIHQAIQKLKEIEGIP